MPLEQHFFGFGAGHFARDVVGLVVEQSQTAVRICEKAVDNALYEYRLARELVFQFLIGREISGGELDVEAMLAPDVASFQQ